MKIGLTYTGSDAKHENYVRWITGEDELEVVKLDVKTANLADMQDCDGLVLSGGVDIDPELYDGGREYVKSPEKGWQTERDLFEQAVLQMAWERGLPVLGVCRGLQLINVSLGGTLVQDLGVEGDEVHENVQGTDKMHPVSVMTGSLLQEVAGREAGVANSAHHQAIDRLGEGLQVSCRAGDGTIEGIEWADPAGKPFMLAVQWHPERMYTHGLADSFLYKEIRDRFMEEIRRR
jgi:putative glutamine amidotransferase